MFVGTGAGGAENATIEDKNSRKQSFVFWGAIQMNGSARTRPQSRCRVHVGPIL
jgi:hypothetical protein